MHRAGGELLPVYLHCSDEEIARRIGNPDRVQRRKTSSVEALNAFRTVYNDAAVPRANCLKLDSGTKSAKATALDIVRHFGVTSKASATPRCRPRIVTATAGRGRCVRPSALRSSPPPSAWRRACLLLRSSA
jgi:hypothetical protein